MTQSHSVTEMARNFADFVNRVVYRRESFVLMRGKKAVAELRPLPAAGRLADLPALVESLPRLEPSDADAFAADLESGRAAISNHGLADPWQS